MKGVSVLERKHSRFAPAKLKVYESREKARFWTKSLLQNTDVFGVVIHHVTGTPEEQAERLLEIGFRACEDWHNANGTYL